jgi:hypothetical protein
MSLTQGPLTQEKELSSFFNELDTRKGTISHGTLFHFLTSLTQERNYPHILVSFFNELDTRQGTMLMTLILDHDQKRPWLPRGSHQMGEQHSGRDTCQGIQMKNQAPMPPVHDVLHHLLDHQ